MPKSGSRIVVWLLAGLFLLTHAAALAHEYDHTLHKHEVPCAQHFFAGGLDTSVAAKALSFSTVTTTVVAVRLPSYPLASQPTAAYAVRAPPRAV
jgi:hypothetical protein